MNDSENEVTILTSVAESNILVVEDSEFDRTLIVAALKKMGVKNIQVAENGTIGISKIENALAIHKPFDIILSDWKMPGRDGHSLLLWIRNSPKLRGLKFVIVTSSSGETDVKKFLSDGASDFVVKPVSYKILKEKIRLLRTNT